MAPLDYAAPMDCATPEGDDRVKLLRLANRLAVAFWVWAIVVGLATTVGGLYAASVREDLQKNEREHAAMIERNEREREQIRSDLAQMRLYMTETRERQNNALERLREIESEHRKSGLR